MKPNIQSQIFVIRSQKVMLDFDLASLYGVETRRLNEATKRNKTRFPEDFMFQLTEEEARNLMSQNATSSYRHGGRRKLPFAFTEFGIAMLSSVLKSERSIQVNISIMRTFVKLRSFIALDSNLASKVSSLEKETHHLFKIVFEKIDQLEINAPALPPKRRRIGLKS